ncbi:hypothetical protein ACEQ8H_003008 [Pleosporales sp. CAS-2024a]
MHMPSLLLLTLATYASTASASITWTLDKASNPSPDQTDAYARISLAMQRATVRYAQYSSLSKSIRVAYAPGVPTAEANYNGDLRFGSDRAYMSERTAMHEISHTLGNYDNEWSETNANRHVQMVQAMVRDGM